MKYIEFKSPALVGCFLSDVWKEFNYLPEHAGIYLLTDTNLNKQYVGSSLNVRGRVVSYLMPNSETYKKVLFSDVNPRYIKVSLLEDCENFTLDELREREQYWINELNTLYPNGLNTYLATKGKVGRDMKPHLKLSKGFNNLTPCYHLLKFSFRFDYFVEKVKLTPINHNWFFDNRKPRRLIPSRLRYIGNAFSDIKIAGFPEFDRVGNTMYYSYYNRTNSKSPYYNLNRTSRIN